MSKKPKGSKILNFGIHDPTGSGEPEDFSLQSNSIHYYEDVTDPTIHMTVSIIDAYGKFNKLPVRSGSKVEIEIEDGDQTLRFDDETEPLYISNILGYQPEAKKESYTLVLETKSAFDNHIKRVFEKYTGKLSTHVEKILKDKLEIPEDRMSIEETSNNYDFCGGYRRPLQCCSWLSPKGIPMEDSSDGDGTAGYLFYQTQDGYVFSSIDALFEVVKEDKDSVAKYEYKMDKMAVDVAKNKFTFSGQPIVKSNHNILEQLVNGQFRTANWYYNIITRKPQFAEYSYADSVGEGEGSKTPMKLSGDVSNIPVEFDKDYSRIMLSTVDTGCLSSKGEQEETPSDQFLFQAQSSTRYSSLFSQTIDITVPLNLEMRAGMMIYLKLPELNKTTTDGPASGFYLVSKLCHQIGGNGDYTGLTLVRDSYIELT